MARVSDAEKREAITYVAAGDIPPPDDIDAAFDEWRSGFESGEEPGKLRAYQIPLDERGNPIATAKNQVRLGSWPIDLYGFDELCTMLIRDFMPPEKILAVRLLGIKPGTAGVQFNKIVILRAPKFNPETNGAAAPGESLSGLMKTIQDANERTLALVQSMRPPQQPDNSVERLIAMSQAMNQPMIALMTALAPALAGRGGGGMDVAGLSGLLDVATKIADLKGGGGGDESTGNDIVDAIRAIVPIAKPALEAIPSILAQRPQFAPAAGPRPAITGPQQQQGVQGPRPPPGSGPRPVPTGPAPGSMPSQPPPQAVGVNPAPSMNDIPTGDQDVFAQLKPQIDALVAMAGQGSDAVGAADLLFDTMIMELPDDYYSKLADIIGGQNFIKNAAVFNPGVTAHADWFRAFQQQIAKRYDDEEKAADGTQPSG